MINGLYSGASAMDIATQQQEMISSNLAHLNTPGHKRMLLSFHEQLDKSGNKPVSLPGSTVGMPAIDFSQGRREATGRPLDVAIGGDGFFTFQGAESEIYSRNGILFRDPTGQLVNSDGLAILDNGNPITIPPEVSDRELVIDQSGAISANGTEFGTLSIVAFEDNQLLESENQTYFRKGNAVEQPSENVTISQGARELSNAHPVTELISLIVGSRLHESAQRAIRTLSEALQQNVRA